MGASGMGCRGGAGSKPFYAALMAMPSLTPTLDGLLRRKPAGGSRPVPCRLPFAKTIVEQGQPTFDAERNSAAESVDTPAEIQQLAEGCSTHA
jgi:hypothetical protein